MGQVDFADSLGLTNASISRIETGAITPRPSIIKTICSVYNVNRSWLETGQGEMFLKTEPAGAGVREGSPEYRREARNPESQQYHDMLDAILDKGSDTMKSAIKSNLVAFHQAVSMELTISVNEEQHKAQVAAQEERLQTIQKEFEALKAFVSELSPGSKLRSPASGVGASQGTPGDHKT